MVKAVALALIAVAIGAAQRGPVGEVTLRDLTVPPASLPDGCALAATPVAALYPMRENPWIGTDAPSRAMIRERIEGPVMTADPPGLTRKDLAAFRLHLADGVDEAYAAVYKQSETTPIVVYAMRLTDAGTPSDWRETPAHDNPRISRVSLGSIAAIVIGDGGKCFTAVGAHLRGLANR
jgi:hypothetical protein